MAKAAPNQVLDPNLTEIATSTRLVVCSAEPANFAGIAAVTLATYTLTAGDGNGDFTIADGDTSGRKLTVAAQSGNNASASGDATHVSLDDGTDLQYVTTCPTQAVVSGSPCNVGAWDIEIADPS